MTSKTKTFEDECSSAARRFRAEMDNLENGTPRERAAAIKNISKVTLPFIYALHDSKDTDATIDMLLEEDEQ